MRKMMMAILVTGIICLTLMACGNQNQVMEEESYQFIFQDSVFLGDSITEGLSFHDVLDEANVLAGAGKTAQISTAVTDDVKNIASRNPERVFIQLGSDDILWPTDEPIPYSLSHYAKLIRSIKDELPNASITLLSVTPVTPEAEKKEPRYKQIGVYNQELQELALSEQVGFVDLSPIFNNSQGLHDTDGIHFKAEFYTLMLDFLKDQLT